MKMSRRAFIGSASAAAGGALVIGFSLRHRLHPVANVQQAQNPLDAWVHIHPDNRYQIVFAKSEMGQGIYTALPMLIADEADLDWDHVEVVQSEFSLGTGGSGSVVGNFMPLRKAGATVRTLMVAAAAQRWGVAGAECATAKGQVLHAGSGRRATYGELVDDARKLQLPDAAQVKLKDPSQYKLIGHATQHLDIPAKCSGTACFGLDVRRPEMVYAVIARCPTYGGSPARFDPTKALTTAGVLQVFEIPARGKDVLSAGGVVVVAKNTWAALQGRKALDITWNHGPNANESSESLRAQMRDLLNKPPMWSSTIAGPDPDTVQAATRVETTYEFPFLSHACMEPMNVTVHIHDGMCEAWCPSQTADWTRTAIAQELGMFESNVTVHTTFMGGGFGRRYTADFQTEAAQIARHVNGPVQLVWTREDDMTHDFYRPTGIRRMRGALDEKGDVVAWSDHLADPSINAMWHKDRKIDGGEMLGRIMYPVPNFQLHYSLVQSAVPRAWWRSVENSFNVLSVECFVDELAQAAKQDPLEFRRRQLQRPQLRPQGKPDSEDRPFEPARMLAVLDLVKEKSGWGSPLGPHRGRGIACTAVYAYLAQVAEVTVEHDTIRVDRLITAIDCGQVVNPNGARHQLEGGMLFTMSSVLKEAITIKNGAAEQQNFDDYSVLRMVEAPKLETWFVESHADPHGLGEAAVGLTGPAIANAVFAATGKRLHRFPLRMDEGQA